LDADDDLLDGEEGLGADEVLDASDSTIEGGDEQ